MNSTLGRSLVAGAAVGLLCALFANLSLDTEFLIEQAPQAGWWSTLPPLVAIALAVATRKLLPALLAGVFVAAMIHAGGSPISGVGTFAIDYLWGSFFDPFHLAVLIFTSSLIGLVHVASRAGATQRVAELVMRFAKGARGAQVSTAFMGFAVFFDDYANTAVVGPTMRPLFDKMRLSREKLAYIIDSTAAPIAGLAIISTWIGAEVGYLQDAAARVGVEKSGYLIFFEALGYRFYCIFALLLVLLVTWLGRDFGPMFKAERRSFSTGAVIRPGAHPLASQEHDEIAKIPPTRARWVLLPIGLVLGTLLTVVYVLGAPSSAGVLGLFSFSVWQQAFVESSQLEGGNALSYALAWAALAGSLLAVFLPALAGHMPVQKGLHAWWRGVRGMAIALSILVLAWALSKGCSDIGTAPFAVAALRGRIAAEWVPLVVFVVSGIVAFSTGTSWGTMAILIPTAAHIAYTSGGEGIMLIAMAAVLDGAIFGDHCSPISDTTVLSSICSGCDHLDHVKTQIPYALLGGLVAATCGYVLVAVAGGATWMAYPLGAACLLAAVWFIGRDARAAA